MDWLLQANGTACAVGSNNSGQLGDGTTVNRLVPVTVAGLTGLVAVVNRLVSQSGSESRRNCLELGI